MEPRELGASTCVEIDECNVVDLWGGYCNAERTKDWERDTITTIWSTTKVNTALAANILVNRALLDPAERISTYWAEFAANGKVNILVSHVLSHSSELPSWESPNTVEDLYNAEKAAERIAAQALWWTPGEQLGYHLVTQGCFVGELVRRTTGQSLAQFITDEIANPLRVDCRFGALKRD
ncbi:beta-lactamase-domain-containing protein [Aspergillus nidulans var. acristatus]